MTKKLKNKQKLICYKNKNNENVFDTGILTKDVKEAVLEDFEDLESLIDSLNKTSTIEEVLIKLNIHLKLKKRRFGDFN